MTEPKRVLYRGVSMIEGWPEKILQAQNFRSYQLGEKDIPRVAYGSEQDDWGAYRVACHDCGVIKGEFHVPNCDVEECPACGGQIISCDCPFDGRSETF